MMIKRYIVLFAGGDVDCMCDLDNYKTCPRRLRENCSCEDMMVSFVPVKEDPITDDDYIPGGGFSKTLSHCDKYKGKSK